MELKEKFLYKEQEVAFEILKALLQNPERYKYIAGLVESGKISQEEANIKNIHKSFKIAESFLSYCDEWEKQAEKSFISEVIKQCNT